MPLPLHRLRLKRDAVGILREIRYLGTETQRDSVAPPRFVEQKGFDIHLVGAQHRLGELIEFVRTRHRARFLRG